MMSRFARMIAFAVPVMTGLLLLSGCGNKDGQVADAPPPPPAEPALVADDDLSYRNEPLMADSGTPPTVFDAAEPGDSELMDRSFENAPPMIPHNVDGLLPITGDDNMCLECHAPENAADAEAIPTPASHLYDMRRDKELSDVNPANYNCTLCHAPQANTGELVENTFEPHYRAPELKESSNLLDTLNEGVEK